MRVALLADFGSTYTKVLAVDLAEGALVGSGQHPTTLTGEILDGYEDASRAALKEVKAPVDVALELGASSAGGGMRMAAIGLVESLTAAAAAAAALNAGARLIGTFTGRLAEADARRLGQLAPEIILFAGGIDGGQEDLVFRNAEAVAGAVSGSHVVVACNKVIAGKVGGIFEASARTVTVVSNILPDIGTTSFEAAREAIEKIFIGDVIAGKQLSASPGFARLVQMATPDAVLRGAVACAGTREAGAGDGIVVTDVGGATTDIYSVLWRQPLSGFGTARKGFIRSPEMRTVQGDLGLRSNARGVLAADRAWLERTVSPPGADGQGSGAETAPAGSAPWLDAACERRQRDPEKVFASGPERDLDEHLAVSCMYVALERHCGHRGVKAGIAGRTSLVEQGVNLTGCRMLIAGGGILRATPGSAIARAALGRLGEHVLGPRNCRVIVDRRYVLAAAGLLAQNHLPIAESLLSRELREETADDNQ
jgi:uncharacterized protein (TIGR01319 family)